MTVPPATWTDCDDGFECATVDVPRDYADPFGPALTLALIRLPARDADNRIGSLLTNPGGPGESGVSFVRRAGKSFFTGDLRDRFDIVGFDPRGVAASQPSVDCADDLDPIVEADPSPDDTGELEQARAAADDLARGCEQRSGAILPYIATLNAARDMDLIRAALGDDKLTYLGFSYGTLLGATYAELFPQNIRAMALDGAVDPALPPIEDVRAQIIGFERALDAFLAACNDEPGCDLASDGDAGAAFDAVMAGLERQPVPADDGREVGPGLAWLGAAAALYNEASWPALDSALSDARDGDGTALASLADVLTGRNSDGTYDNSLETRLAINCLDFPHLTAQETQALLADLRVSAPRFGPNSGLASADPCDFWPVPPQRVAHAIAAPGAPPIVVIGTTGDPATPYQQAVALANQLESGVLLTFDGEGHTAYRRGNVCIADAVDAYLLALNVPPDGTVC